MPELALIYGTFMLISLSGALSPGPLTAMSITEGARSGRWAGVRLAVGHGLVEVPLMFGIAYGLGAWLRQPVVSGLAGLLGAGVLIWMGYGLAADAWRGQLRLKNAETLTLPAPGAMRYGHLVGGAALTLFNPYWVIWWATVGSAYVGQVAALGLGLVAVAGLALTHWLTDLGWLGGLAWLVGSGSRLIGERTYRLIMLVCGGFLIVFGLYLAWSGVGFLAGR